MSTTPIYPAEDQQTNRTHRLHTLPALVAGLTIGLAAVVTAATGTRPRRKSSRSPDHAPHVVRGDAVDGKDGAWTEAPRPLYRPPSWNPSGAGATKGLCPRRHRTSAANDRREEWISRPREWKGPRGVERHLVHRIRTPLRLDRSLAANPQWPSHSRSGHRRVLSRSLLRRAPLPLLAELGAVGRCGTRCQAHRRPHRYHRWLSERGPSRTNKP